MPAPEPGNTAETDLAEVDKVALIMARRLKRHVLNRVRVDKRQSWVWDLMEGNITRLAAMVFRSGHASVDLSGVQRDDSVLNLDISAYISIGSPLRGTAPSPAGAGAMRGAGETVATAGSMAAAEDTPPAQKSLSNGHQRVPGEQTNGHRDFRI